tara:strand:+ start:40 stop:174 length:135 start_codon:yes stop_codon:yes gene_type:complete
MLNCEEESAILKKSNARIFRLDQSWLLLQKPNLSKFDERKFMVI